MPANITQFGRVEFDPLSIPRVSLRDDSVAADDASFASSLERISARGREERRDAERSTADRQPSESDASPEFGEQPQTPTQPSAETVDRVTGDPRNGPETSGDSPESDQPLGEAVAGRRHAKTGKGPVAASPDLSTDTGRTGNGIANAGFAGVAAAAAAAAGGTTAGNGAASLPSPAAGAVTATTGPGAATPTAGSAGSLGPAGLEPSALARVRSTEAAAPGYRSSTPYLDPATLRLAEAQRDSMFRQVGLRLTPDGGEMHVFLDPPELGELELRMVVERGGEATRLTVVAERPEVAWIMQRHMAELRAQLEAQGLHVTEASVQTREESDRHARPHGERGANEHHDPSGGTDRDATESALSNFDPTPRGYIHADGLEIWI